MFDTHLHTKFSTDSKMSIDEALKASIENNMGIIITEHMDLAFKSEGKFCFDPKSYFEKYMSYRNENLLLGIELGMEKERVKEAEEIIKNNPFDYVIGSIHTISEMDLYFDKFYDGKTKEESYREYFNHMIYNLGKYDFIDSLAHIDYVARYNKYTDSEIYYEEFSYMIDEVLRILAKKEKSMEINTRRLKDKKALKNLVKIYKRFYELGGKTVTIGSDAHNPSDIGKNFKTAKEIAEFCKLKVVYYKDRKVFYDKNI
ncbi:histidinol phosphate phosphatase [Clostridium niameyense]|uniref:Histidinol-phosphatase n=1 Tax=Clostridium niameyense TaxID=1622073 RepID=A0A6M0R718_9CLOT|nr:histidinol phosphate phosphatase [Clostridium niameyense]NEZ45963.1 histidinol phosphate phosphatase [Clostridium niameyense]